MRGKSADQMQVESVSCSQASEADDGGKGDLRIRAPWTNTRAGNVNRDFVRGQIACNSCH